MTPLDLVAPDLNRQADDDLLDALGRGEITQAEYNRLAAQQWDAEVDSDPLLAKALYEDQDDDRA